MSDSTADSGAGAPLVLSVQSWVTHGWVGNKCSVLAFSRFGIEADPLLTVSFSQHTNYPQGWTGRAVPGDELAELWRGLCRRGATVRLPETSAQSQASSTAAAGPDQSIASCYTHLLTGYLGSAEQLRLILSFREQAQQLNGGRKLFFALDPVMGDDGRLYVKPELVDAYRTLAVPAADLILPNQTELE